MYVYVNENKIDTPCRTLQELKHFLYPDYDMTVINGYLTSEDYPLNEGDEIHFMKRGVVPTQEELESSMVARHTPKIHEKLKKAKVAIAGLGGLGSNIAVMLARIGVGELLIIDYDVVVPSNLNRQSYYVKHIGLFKADALEEQLKDINPFINISKKIIKLEEENIPEVFSGYDIICEAFDNPEYKAILVNIALLNFPETPIVSASGMAGYYSSNIIKTQKKMKNLYICGDCKNEAAIGVGLMAPRVTICAAHQANMILRLILDIDNV